MSFRLSHSAWAVLLFVLPQPAGARELRVSTQPSPVVLEEQPTSIVINVGGLPGTGEVKAAVNVGRVDAIQTMVDGAQILFTTPMERRFPQVLCLLLWRAGGTKVYAARVPLRSLPNPRADRTYNQLTLAVSQQQIAVAATTALTPKPEVEVDGVPVTLVERAPGLWATSGWGGRAGRVKVTAWLPDKRRLAQHAELILTPSFDFNPTDGKPSRKVKVVLGAAMGLIHNTGELFSPRLAAEVGLDYQLPLGAIGLRGLVSVSWDDQQLEGSRTASADVLLLPFGGALCYRLPLRVLTPYVLLGVMAQLVRTTTTISDVAEEQVVNSWGMALLGQLGVERELGPGWIFIQSGFQWGAVDTTTIEMLAGGIVVEGGYRFRL